MNIHTKKRRRKTKPKNTKEKHENIRNMINKEIQITAHLFNRNRNRIQK